MNYVDVFANRTEAAHRKLSADTSSHLARSCFANILQSTHQQARSSGVPHEAFRDNIREVIDQSNIPAFTEVDTQLQLPGKRQPSLSESFDATIDRYIAIDRLKDVFRDSADAMVYGGSMKYGPFLNVRSGADASDIDAIVFTDAKDLGNIDWRRIMETDLFEERDKITFFARLGLQRALSASDLIDITSQRFVIADQDYTISTHFIPTEFMDEAYPTATSDSSETTYHKYVRDYKERPFERTHVSNHDMSSTLHDVPVYNTPTQGGFVASNPAYSMVQERYVPGMYQNLVLPDAHFIVGKSSRSSEHLQEFSAFVSRQEEQEKRFDPDASTLNTEPRKPILPLDVSDILGS